MSLPFSYVLSDFEYEVESRACAPVRLGTDPSRGPCPERSRMDQDDNLRWRTEGRWLPEEGCQTCSPLFCHPCRLLSLPLQQLAGAGIHPSSSYLRVGGRYLSEQRPDGFPMTNVGNDGRGRFLLPAKLLAGAGSDHRNDDWGRGFC